MKSLIKLFLVLAIVIAGGYAIAMVTTDVERGEEVHQAATQEPLSITFPDTVDSKVNDWVFERYPRGEIVGGKMPYSISATGLPFGLEAFEDNGEIILQGIPRETGSFDVSFSVRDANEKTNLKKTTMTVEPVDLNQEKLLKQRADWLNEQKEPTYEPIKTYDGFSTIMNWVLQK